MRYTLGERLTRLRNKKGVSQAEAATEIGIDSSTLCKYEKNQCDPSKEALMKLADYYRVEIDYIVGRKPGRIVNNLDDINRQELLQVLEALREQKEILEKQLEKINVLISNIEGKLI